MLFSRNHFSQTKIQNVMEDILRNPNCCVGWGSTVLPACHLYTCKHTHTYTHTPAGKELWSPHITLYPNAFLLLVVSVHLLRVVSDHRGHARLVLREALHPPLHLLTHRRHQQPLQLSVDLGGDEWMSEYECVCVLWDTHTHRNIVDKCKEEPKLFYRFIYGKIKHQESIAWLKENREVLYEDLKEMSEVLNKNFQKVFTIESDFQKPQG